MLVSGIGSEAHDPTFDALVSALLADPRYEVHRFGADPAHPYDTLGSIDANADQLTAQIRELAKTHPKVEIVAHSMGGVVVDSAFRRGLSVADKVDTYIALASPHDGSTLARVGETFLDIADWLGIKAEFREVSAYVGHDLGAQAVKDLASAHAQPVPPGVNRVDVRIATDGIVIAPDARTPGTREQLLLPSRVSLEGHGGATVDPRVLEIVTSTIASRPQPATDWRGQILERAAAVVSAIVTRIAVPFFCAACALGLCVAGCLWVMRRRPRLAFP
jgi:hypothetical protein